MATGPLMAMVTAPRSTEVMAIIRLVTAVRVMGGPIRTQDSRNIGIPARTAVEAGRGIEVGKDTDTMKEAKATAGADTMTGVDPAWPPVG